MVLADELKMAGNLLEINYTESRITNVLEI